MNRLKYIWNNSSIRANANIALLTFLVTILGVVAAVAAINVAVSSYNHRYDADATSSGGLEYTFAKNQNEGSGDFTASAGKLTYGYFQKSGPTNTNYVIKYKKASESSFKTLKAEFTIYTNNDYYGKYDMQTNKYSTRYNVKVERKNNKSKTSVFEFDYGIE